MIGILESAFIGVGIFSFIACWENNWFIPTKAQKEAQRKCVDLQVRIALGISEAQRDG